MVGEEGEEELLVEDILTGNDKRMKTMLKMELLVSQRRRLNASWKSARIIFRACYNDNPCSFSVNKHRRIGKHNRCLQVGVKKETKGFSCNGRRTAQAYGNSRLA